MNLEIMDLERLAGQRSVDSLLSLPALPSAWIMDLCPLCLAFFFFYVGAGDEIQDLVIECLTSPLLLEPNPCCFGRFGKIFF